MILSDTSLTEDEDIDATEEESVPQQTAERSKDLSGMPMVSKQLLQMYKDIEQGFTDQVDRANDQMDYWDIYNCKLGPNQFYSGNSKIFVPIVHNAINARVTRFVNQIFPQSGRYVDITTEDGTMPQAIAALLEDYVDKAKLRTEIMPALIRSGDVEGQYNLYVDWCRLERHVAMKVQKPIETEDAVPVPGNDVEDIHEETILDQFPDVEVLADSDVLVLPQTADSLEKALEAGGSVTVLRRWTAAKIRSLMAEGAIGRDAGKALIQSMSRNTDPTKNNRQKQMVDAAGIKVNDSGVRFALVYETWAKIKVPKSIGGGRRIVRAYMGGPDKLLGCTLNPFWSDRLPILSAPAEKVAGSFKGLSKVKFCADQQYYANDVTNEGADSSMYALMPIVMTDPEKNPRVGSMVLALAAIWETNPNDTQFVEFPKLWQDALQLVSAATAQIATSLSVSPAAITQQASDKNLSQAEISNEQSVDILTTADAVTVLEEGILTPFLQRAAEMDHQYRDDEVIVRQYGSMGVRAVMQAIPPIQMDRRYKFTWLGVENARNAQQMQQQIAAINVLRGIPPQSYPGYRLNLVPAIAQMVENSFGPRLAPLLFEDMRDQLSLAPDFENTLLTEGIDLAVHPMDNDVEHMQKHMMLMQTLGGDPTGVIRVHLERHKMSLEQKTAQAMQMGQTGGPTAIPGQPGVPGGAGPGVAGTPRIGAQPGQPRNGQQPPGAIHKDQMHDPRAMPRQ